MTPRCTQVLSMVRRGFTDRATIAEKIGTTPQAVGGHLYILRELGLVKAKQVGRHKIWQPVVVDARAEEWLG